MKIEPWVPSFMRKIADIWREDSTRDYSPLIETVAESEPKRLYVYRIKTTMGFYIEVKYPRPLIDKELIGKTFLRTEAP